MLRHAGECCSAQADQALILDSDQIPEELKRKAIAKILASDTLKRSEQLRRLFNWLRLASLTSHAPPSEYEVGVGALRRSKDFDPQSESLVRREMCRLREKLTRYYASEGRQEPLRLDCGNGYRMHFRWAAPPTRTNEQGTPCLLILPLRTTGDLTAWATSLFDELFLRLGGSPFVQLVAQTTCLRYAGRTGDIRDFAAETGAELVLEGNVRREPPALARSTLWLVDGKSGLIRDQCLLADQHAAEAAQLATNWLRERPELKISSPLRSAAQS